MTDKRKPKDAEAGKVYKADYADATPEQVAGAVLGYRPKEAGLSRGEAKPKPPLGQP